MRTSDYEYELPPNLIAQEPARERADARMLVLERVSGRLTHQHVRDLAAWLRAGDVLVVNDTRVIPARLFGVKPDTGGRVEVLFLEAETSTRWTALCRASRRPRVGSRLRLAGGRLSVRVIATGEGGRVTLESESERPLLDWLDAYGVPPLPPYIRRPAGGSAGAEDRERYQTLFAREPGAVAAPTAGLHFSAALLEALAAKGVARAAVTLHVGPGTFKPVTVEDPAGHVLDAERYAIHVDAASQINAARPRGGRIVAVGSTAVRTLETVADAEGHVHAGAGRSALFIRPPYAFNAVDALMTNFHLPRSTLLMMVCAFGGREQVLAAYREAVREGYRFYSYGDCMLLV